MKLPETIYLTQGEDYEEWSPVMETLWREDKLNDLDVSYICSDLYEAALNRIKELEGVK